MNNLKLLLLGLIAPLLCGVSFAFTLDQSELNYLNNNSISSGHINSSSKRIYLVDLGYTSVNTGVCVLMSNITINSSDRFNFTYTDNPNNNASVQFPGLFPINDSYNLYCLTMSNRYLMMLKTTTNNIQFDYVSFYSDKFFNGKIGFDIQGLLDNYNQCSDDLSICDTSVQQCLIDKETLSGSLASCNSDKVSLNNNINSLTLQLQNCLGQSCNGSGVDIGTGTFFNQYSLYRTDDDVDYSTPITNNLFLPLGYKGKINEDNILSIAKINTLETAYQFSETDKPVVINSMGFVMLFFLGTGLLIVVIMYLRRFISKK